jgi:hypothetical protein
MIKNNIHGMKMAKLKRAVEVGFLTIAFLALIAQATSVYLGWRHGRVVDKEILKNSKVEVVKTDPRFPPALLVVYTNSGRLPVEKTHFRLIIELNAIEIARIDRDYGELKPEKTESVLLQSVTPVNAPRNVEPGTTLTYRLLVFPNNKKALPEISGTIQTR